MHFVFREVEVSEQEQQTAPMDFDSIQIHKATIDRLLETDNFVDAMAVYMFYIYTARWQKTARIRAVTTYVSNGIGLSEPRVRRAKKTLIGLDLIRDKQSVRDNKITGHYVEIRFSFYSDSQDISHPNDFPQCGKRHSVENHHTNALSTNSLNALSKSRGNTGKTPSLQDDLVGKKERGRFTPPTLEEVRSFIVEKQLSCEAEGFFNYYESNGWMVGRNKMKSWTHALYGWNEREKKFNKGKLNGNNKQQTNSEPNWTSTNF